MLGIKKLSKIIVRKFVQYKKMYYLCSVQLKEVLNMKEKIELTEEEAELIHAIRNLRSAFPNGYENLLFYAQSLFDKLVDLPEED